MFELKNFYSKTKLEIEANCELRSPIKNRALIELVKIREFLSMNITSLKSVEDHQKILIKTFQTLKK